MKCLLPLLLLPVLSYSQHPEKYKRDYIRRAEVFKRAERFEDSFFLADGYIKGVDSFEMKDRLNVPDSIRAMSNFAPTWWVNYDSTRWCFRYYFKPSDTTIHKH